MRLVLLALSVLALASATEAHAAFPVEIDSSGQDTTGNRFVFALKERIRSTSSLDMTFDESKPRMLVIIATLNPAGTSNSSFTAFSIVITWKDPTLPYPLYITSYVGSVGKAYLQEAADAEAAKISEQADHLTRLWQNRPQR